MASILIEKKKKIIKSFLVIGLNDSLIQKYEDKGESPLFVQIIDIFIKNLPYDYKSPNEDEDWILLIKEKNAWLRIKYSYEYNVPITDLIVVDCDYESPEYILLEKKYIDEQYFPIMVVNDKDKEEEDKNDKSEPKKIYPIINEYKNYIAYSDVYVKIPSYLNIKELLNFSPTKSRCSVFLISRKYTSLPLKNISINRRQDRLFNFNIKRNKSPYNYKYIPTILDQFPPAEENNSSVSMFCFPNGLKIMEKYRMPTWFTFVLTDEVGERTYGSTLIFVEELQNSSKENFIPIYDEFDQKTKKRKYLFIPKAICILSKFPFYHNCLLFLKQLYRIQTASKSKIPLERAICTFVDSLYLSNDEITQFLIGEERLSFFRISNYGELWDTNYNYLDVLFRVISFKHIVTAWQGLLLEKKLFLLCSSKATLSCVAHALVNLLFPFKWIHVYVPILPEKLKLFIDSPVPLIIGISFKVDLNDFPTDALILNINKNEFENNFSQIPRLSGKLNAILEKKYKNLKEKYNLGNPANSDKWMDFQDAPFPTFELDNHTKIDTTEIRDIFYNVFITMFKNYKKFIDWEQSKKYLNNSYRDEEEDISQKIFKKKHFLKDNGCNDENDFVALFSETSLFNQFIETFLKINPDGAMGYFLDSINNGKGDKKVYLPDIKPETITILPEIDIRDLKGKTFFHPIFPNKLDSSLYIKYKRPKNTFKQKFIKYEDEWCYNMQKLKKKEWPKYLMYLIYEIWFHFFSFVIHFYEDKESLIMMDYAFFLMEDLYNNKKITPTRTLFCKLFKSCGRNKLSSNVKKILLLVNKIYKNAKYSNLFHNAYLSGLYALTENSDTNSNITIPSSNSYLNITAIRATILNEIYSDNYDTKLEIDNILFIGSKICPNCVKNKSKLYKIHPEHILSGFSLGDNNSYIICPKCLTKIDPYIYYLIKSKSHLKPHKFRLIPPYKLIQDLDLIINKNREIFFYKRPLAEDLIKFQEIHFSIIFYFLLFDLPLFVLYTPNNNDNSFLNEITEDIQLNKMRKLSKKNRKKSGKSISPDRVSRSPDRSLDGKSRVSADLTEISGKSSLSNISELENEIWQNIQKSSQKEVFSQEKINSNEKSEFESRFKYINSELSKLMQYFYSDSKYKIDAFLQKISEIKENDNNLGLKDEKVLKGYTKTSSNNNLNFNNDIKMNVDKNYDDILKNNNEKIKTRNMKTNFNINMNHNLQKKISDEIKENKNDSNYQINKEDNNMSFSGIIEIQEDKEKKIKNKNKKNENILDIIEEEEKSNIDTDKKEFNNKNFKQFKGNNNFSHTNKNEFNITNSEKGNKNYSENLEEFKSYHNQTSSDKNKNTNNKNENKISEFDLKDNTVNESSNKNTNNTSSYENSLNNKNTDFQTSGNENQGRTKPNPTTAPKKKRKIKIYSEDFSD